MFLITNLRAMKAIIQRVSAASVVVEGETIGKIGQGYLILLGVTHADTEKDSAALANKTLGLRIFQDDEGKMNRSIEDVAGSILVISQFTLYADTRKGNRPSFVNAAPHVQAKAIYDDFVEQLRQKIGRDRVQTGQFAAVMSVALVNEGPVTITLSTDD